MINWGLVPFTAVGTVSSVSSDQGKREAHAMNAAISPCPRAVSGFGSVPKSGQDAATADRRTS
jgi:hypothetical protein